MAESRETVAVVEGRLDDELLDRMFEAAAEGTWEERIRNGLDVAVDLAEANPAKARVALWRLRGEQATLERVEACMDGSPKRAILGLGAAIQLAESELGSPAPNLRSRMPELLRWLEGDW